LHVVARIVPDIIGMDIADARSMPEVRCIRVRQ